MNARDIRPDVSVVAPVFNEAATLPELVARISAALSARGDRFEIVVVDDGSTDATAARLMALHATHPALRVVTLSRNFGQAAALCCGIFAARGAVVVTIDGDLQNPPEEIPRLLDAMGDGVDVVTARRAVQHQSTWRRIGSRFVQWIAHALIGRDIQDFGGQFKAYRREVIEATRSAWAPGKPFFALAAWLGFRIVEIPVRHDARRVGRSRYRLTSLVRLNVDLITSFTTMPLALLAVMSALTGVPGIAGVAWCLWTGARDGMLAPLSLLLVGLSGVFFAAAALGVYLARVYRTISGGPTGYVVRSDHEGATEEISVRRDGAARGS